MQTATTVNHQRDSRAPAAELRLILRPLERAFAAVLLVSILLSAAAPVALRAASGAGVGPLVASALLSFLLSLVIARRMVVVPRKRRARLSFDLWLTRHGIEESEARREYGTQEEFRLIRAIPRQANRVMHDEGTEREHDEGTEQELDEDRNEEKNAL